MYTSWASVSCPKVLFGSNSENLISVQSKMSFSSFQEVAKEDIVSLLFKKNARFTNIKNLS